MLGNSVLIILCSCVMYVMCFFRQNNVCRTLEDYRTIFRNKNCSYNPDVGSSPRLIAKRYGYPFENHAVVTEDGYILNLHRIPGSRNGSAPSNGTKRRKILIIHGLAANSAFFMLRGKRSLAFYLADSGFDVWMGNLRGNQYSSKHVNPTIKSRDYWNFGFHEMAIYDLPACIDFIANRTGEKGNLIYIGHSMGTTISYIYSTVKKRHAEENLKAIISLAPVAYMKNIMGTFKILAPFTPFLTGLLKSKGIYALAQYFNVQRAILGHTCGQYPLIIPCNLVLVLSSGMASKQLLPELLPVFFSYYPSAISLKTLQHFSQIVLSDEKFQLFDYGPTKNMQIYNGSIIPPEYDVSQISVPVHLFVGTADIVGDLKDVEILEEKLYKGKTSRPKKHLLHFSHQDFFLAKDIEPFYKSLLEVIRNSKSIFTI